MASDITNGPGDQKKQGLEVSMELLLQYGDVSYKFARETWSMGFRYKEEWLQFFCKLTIPRWITPNGVICHLYSHSAMLPELIAILVASAVVTDVIDGPLARVRQQESIWGANIDPIADKMIILIVVYFELISIMPTLYWIIFWCEVISTFLRPISYWLGFDAKANDCGKTKMVLQTIALIPIYFGNYSLAKDLLILAFVVGSVSLAIQSSGPIKLFADRWRQH